MAHRTGRTDLLGRKKLRFEINSGYFTRFLCYLTDKKKIIS
jgi:hypothetical protein